MKIRKGAVAFDVTKFITVQIIRLLREHDVIEDQNTDDGPEFLVIVAAMHLLGEHFGLIMEDLFHHVFQVLDLDLNLDEFAGRGDEFDIKNALFVFRRIAIKEGVCDEHTGILLRSYAQNGGE
ncbi:hypothetical protein FACS1894130_11840 [Spirochaetia bacterium]|nr:hypothetical protein FACS1894130_11840 [Spirochaetia bacterium]